MSGEVTSKDGTRIGYDEVGSGPPLVLIDPACCYRGFGPMGQLAAALAPHFTVFTYDRRGRGESADTLPYAVEREVEDLAAMIDVAGGAAALYGFSSGAALALHAAVRGLPVPRMALLEPPVSIDGPPSTSSELGEELTALVAAGRRGDAVEHFQTSIGVPPEMLAGMRESPAWPALEAIAHTLPYDQAVTSSVPVDRLATVTTPTLVLDSVGSDDRLRGWARGVAGALPDGRYVSLAGNWHDVEGGQLVTALVDFFTER